MSTTAQALLNIMTVRLKMQEDGTISTARSVKDATRQLVSQLVPLSPEEDIEVLVVERDPLHARYIRTKTGQILAEIHGQET